MPRRGDKTFDDDWAILARRHTDRPCKNLRIHCGSPRFYSNQPSISILGKTIRDEAILQVEQSNPSASTNQVLANVSDQPELAPSWLTTVYIWHILSLYIGQSSFYSKTRETYYCSLVSLQSPRIAAMKNLGMDADVQLGQSERADRDLGSDSEHQNSHPDWHYEREIFIPDMFVSFASQKPRQNLHYEVIKRESEAWLAK